jgi:hypothetical protein
MTDKEKHWCANDLMVRGIFDIQTTIEEFKADLKTLKNDVTAHGLSEAGAIHLLDELRDELEIFEYMQELLDQKAEETSTTETVRDYINKVKDNENNKGTR